jgi:two-component system, NtrC family, response regulator HydG
MSVSRHILVVDDEESVRMTLAANLELGGYEVTVAEDGQRAVELVANEAFDLVITDVRMPRRSGLDAFREIKRLRPGLAVIMMTAFTAEAVLDQAFAEGVYAVLHKPFSMERLLALIPRAIARGSVLVVDDSVDQAKTIVRMLEVMGVRAEAAYDGPSAVRRVQQNDVDVCVLDLVMPEMDGVATCEAIRRFDQSIAVVGISAHSVPDMIHKLASVGGATCLRKPFDGPALAKVIAQARAAAVRS